MQPTNFLHISDPLHFKEALWPQVDFYPKQTEIVRSVWQNDETYVPAGNKLGKDFISAFIVLAYFIMHLRLGGVRIVTTSVKDDHLRVLWGEIGWFIANCKYPLTMDKGGPLRVNYRDIRAIIKGQECPISYLRGMVSEKGEGMAGHHAPHTLIVGDEASGLDDQVYEQSQGWAKRMLWIGNPNETQNFWRKGIKKGDLLASS